MSGLIDQSTGVSVVIPTYNRAERVLEAIESALNQDWEPLEIVVVDDASTDDTVTRLGRLAEREPRVRVIVRSANGGAAAARNEGVTAARQPYVAFLDSDCLFTPGKLAAQMPGLLAAPESAVSFSGYVLCENALQSSVLLDGWSPDPGAVIAELLEQCCVNTSTFIARRDSLMKAGLFRPEMEVCEDHDLWLRLAMLGHEFLYEDAPLTVYRFNETSISSDPALVARYSTRMIKSFLERPDLPLEIRSKRSFYRSRWALSSTGRFLEAQDGRSAMISLGRAVLTRPQSLRPGWLILAGRAVLTEIRSAARRAARAGRSLR